MGKHLVVVESPAKAKTIKKYLGKDFEVLASYGHVRDLLPKEGAVDPENDFAMHYRLVEKNTKHVDSISHAMQKADALYLATDPDREGEAISWHLQEILHEKKLLENKPVHRVVFHEITKNAVQDAVNNPRKLAMDLVDAQQTRRALDYLVGFNLSPLLWKKIRYGLSAGRVQSPALRLIVEREIEIEAFKPKEYWSIIAELQKGQRKFKGKLTVLDGTKLKQFSINNEKDASAAKTNLLAAANGELIVEKVVKRQRKQQPSAPFTTSTLQQEAALKLSFGAKKTMQVAQKLYEGIDTGNGAEGLITYMRTDSVNLATEAVDEIRHVIDQRYGKEFLPKQPRVYKSKAKNAQEAHEAIRPTVAAHHPDNIKDKLTKDQFRLYSLIWKRTVACQMIHATLNTVAVDLSCGEGNTFRANGSVLVDPGFKAVYQESESDKQEDVDHLDDEKMLPAMEEGEKVKLKDILTNQHFTEPPPRFSEASLVKSLEEFGIGRPSTYASIISTLLQRDYVKLEKKRFTPTDVGRVVNKFLTEHFSRYVDYDFTARLEDSLDEISRGENPWKPLLNRFWGTFKDLVDEKMKTVKREDVTHEPLDENCPKCEKQLFIRLGKRGRFIGCSGYPECDYTRNLEGSEESEEEKAPPEILDDRECPKCDAPLQIRQGRYGKFIGCSTYPKCKHIEPLEKPEDTGVTCPTCQKGTMVKKRSRFGTFFYACSAYPECRYAISHEPINEPCPTCNWPIIMLKHTKRRGLEKVCTQKKICDYVELVPLNESEDNTPPEQAKTAEKATPEGGADTETKTK